VQEGASTVINCTYVDSTSFYFPWYKQVPEKHSKLIIDSGSSMERKQSERLIVLLDKKAKHFFMHSTGIQAGDSAIYFCAARAHHSQALAASLQICHRARSPINILCHRPSSTAYASCWQVNTTVETTFVFLIEHKRIKLASSHSKQF
ncbi:T cell receptor alpha variable 13-1, partial [Lemmus lemmus]